MLLSNFSDLTELLISALDSERVWKIGSIPDEAGLEDFIMINLFL